MHRSCVSNCQSVRRADFFFAQCILLFLRLSVLTRGYFAIYSTQLSCMCVLSVRRDSIRSVHEMDADGPGKQHRKKCQSKRFKDVLELCRHAILNGMMIAQVSRWHIFSLVGNFRVFARSSSLLFPVSLTLSFAVYCVSNRFPSCCVVRLLLFGRQSDYYFIWRARCRFV